jgi:hypothetical protein
VSLAVQIFSFTPGITYTGMVPDRLPAPAKRLLQRLLFSPDAATYAGLAGLFSRDLRGGDEFWSNAPLLAQTSLGRGLLQIVKRGGRLGDAVQVVFPVLIAVHQQHWYGHITVTPPNEVCSDAALTESLYKWSHAEVHRYNFESKLLQHSDQSVNITQQDEEMQETTVEMQ